MSNEIQARNFMAILNWSLRQSAEVDQTKISSPDEPEASKQDNSIPPMSEEDAEFLRQAMEEWSKQPTPWDRVTTATNTILEDDEETILFNLGTVERVMLSCGELMRDYEKIGVLEKFVKLINHPSSSVLYQLSRILADTLPHNPNVQQAFIQHDGIEECFKRLQTVEDDEAILGVVAIISAAINSYSPAALRFTTKNGLSVLLPLLKNENIQIRRKLTLIQEFVCLGGSFRLTDKHAEEFLLGVLKIKKIDHFEDSIIPYINAILSCITVVNRLFGTSFNKSIKEAVHTCLDSVIAMAKLGPAEYSADTGLAVAEIRGQLCLFSNFENDNSTPMLALM